MKNLLKTILNICESFKNVRYLTVNKITFYKFLYSKNIQKHQAKYKFGTIN